MRTLYSNPFKKSSLQNFNNWKCKYKNCIHQLQYIFLDLPWALDIWQHNFRYSIVHYKQQSMDRFRCCIFCFSAAPMSMTTTEFRIGRSICIFECRWRLHKILYHRDVLLYILNYKYHQREPNLLSIFVLSRSEVIMYLLNLSMYTKLV